MIHGAHVILYSTDADADRPFMCDDVRAFIVEMAKCDVPCSAVEELRWAALTRLTLPGGGKIGVHPPKHASPLT